MNNPEINLTTGTKYWYNDKYQLHRTDGPAIEWTNGYKAWYQNDKRHREDGPAYEGSSKLWFLNDAEYSEEVFYDLMGIMTR